MHVDLSWVAGWVQHRCERSEASAVLSVAILAQAITRDTSCQKFSVFASALFHRAILEVFGSITSLPAIIEPTERGTAWEDLEVLSAFDEIVSLALGGVAAIIGGAGFTGDWQDIDTVPGSLLLAPIWDVAEFADLSNARCLPAPGHAALH